jgi:hypothetical protein
MLRKTVTNCIRGYSPPRFPRDRFFCVSRTWTEIGEGVAADAGVSQRRPDARRRRQSVHRATSLVRHLSTTCSIPASLLVEDPRARVYACDVHGCGIAARECPRDVNARFENSKYDRSQGRIYLHLRSVLLRARDIPSFSKMRDDAQVIHAAI